MDRGGKAGEGVSTPEARFRAFVSYSHADGPAARRLQSRLETYRVPRRLAERVVPLGLAAGRVGPVFRDREDLPASADLSEAVKEALARSQALIVLCSPEAARSIWVAREIELFRALHPDRPILAALIRGTPEEAFPAGIRKNGVEPLAADFRRAGDGRKLAFLKVVAGILGIPLDELIQREGQRRQRRVILITIAAAAAMLVLATMTLLAIDARRDAERQRAEAERQRGEAEGLVEYMLTDLRERLKNVGRLEIMSTVNQRALDYYDGQGRPEDLPDESLERRARVIGVMGEDEELRGHLKVARVRYEALHRATQALLAKNSADPARALVHARSENRLALLDITESDFTKAMERLAAVRRLLASIAPWGRSRDDWLQLAAFAEGNSCATMLKRGERGPAPLGHCLRAVALADRRRAAFPANPSAAYDLTFHLFWLAEAQLAAGRPDAARATQARYLGLTRRLIAGDPKNTLLVEQQMELYVAHADFLRRQGDGARAATLLGAARELSDRLAAIEPGNAIWADYQKRLSAPSARSRDYDAH